MGCLTARDELSRQRVRLASLDNSDTHNSNSGRCLASTRPQDCVSARKARPARQRRQRYKVHIGSICGGLESAELQATQLWLLWMTGDIARWLREIFSFLRENDDLVDMLQNIGTTI